MEIIALVLLGVLAFGLLSIAGTLASLSSRYERPEFVSGQEVSIRAFGVEQRCVVLGYEGRVVVVHPMGAATILGASDTAQDPAATALGLHLPGAP